MKPKDEIDDRNYFKTLRAQLNPEVRGSFNSHGALPVKWIIEPRLVPVGKKWQAGVYLKCGSNIDALDAREERLFPNLGTFDSEEEATDRAMMFAQEWIRR
ncbi:hypothetical protein [Caballeronia sp. RCC_10]|uniref:hypothetical protein n=1 Tax=Caballeronia sp. RCC_10 TaxID=3239227 RepID=UPI003523609A